MLLEYQKFHLGTTLSSHFTTGFIEYIYEETKKISEKQIQIQSTEISINSKNNNVK